jgi:hypothetical protein
MAERSDAPLADDSGGTPNDMPTGMPQGGEEAEAQPLGTDRDTEQDADGEGDTPRGGDAQPGIPTEGEPPASG